MGVEQFSEALEPRRRGSFGELTCLLCVTEIDVSDPGQLYMGLQDLGRIWSRVRCVFGSQIGLVLLAQRGSSAGGRTSKGSE
ncbi:hypothetical protein AOLI_G00220590 [Acnodon oligacanthus]